MLEPNQMRCKVVVSGDIVEMYYYKVPIACGKKKSEVLKLDNNEIKEFEKRTDNLYRCRQNIRRIIWCNQSEYTKFVTLTYKETILDRKKVHRNITTFVQAMRRLNYNMKYLYVLENQKVRGLKENNDGCIHVHMLIFIDKYIPIEDLRRCWKHGYVSIEKIDNVNNLGAYVCKYITKDTLAEFGEHGYECSQGLNRASVERFYTLGYSDTDIDFQPSEIEANIDINFKKIMNHDYLDNMGVGCHQQVTYIQGKWKNKNIIKERDPLHDFERQINLLGLSQDK